MSYRSLLQDHLDLVVGQSIFEAIAKEDHERQALSELVWSGGWTRRKAAGKLVLEHSVRSAKAPTQGDEPASNGLVLPNASYAS